MSFNNKNCSIDHIKLPKSEYQRIKFVIINEMQQGWNPSKDEIKSLIHSDRHPSKMIQNDMKSLDKAMKRDE